MRKRDTHLGQLGARWGRELRLGQLPKLDERGGLLFSQISDPSGWSVRRNGVAWLRLRLRLKRLASNYCRWRCWGHLGAVVDGIRMVARHRWR